jgi:acyl-CoA thioesterase-1
MAGLIAVEFAAVEMSFMKPDAGARPRSALRSYGKLALKVQRLAVAFAVAGLVFSGLVDRSQAAERTIKVVALGDSLTAGFQLRGSAAFPMQLERALKAKGFAVEVANAGVSGDTSSGGLARLDWSVPEGTDAVIVELGANDALRGIDPAVTRAALSDIVSRLKARGIAVLLCGMLAPPNYGADFAARFNAIYPDLAKAFAVPLYPFFLEGVAGNAALNQADGIHPTAEGVEVIVKHILPTVQAFVGTISGQRS